MNVICPKCQKRVQVTDGISDTRVNCPYCRVTLTITPHPQKAPAAPGTSALVPLPPPVENVAVTRRLLAKACPYCGETIHTAAKKCKHCGEFLDGLTRQTIRQAPLYANQPSGRTTQQSSAGRGKAIAALVLGLVGLLVFGIITGIIAIALGCSARNDMRATGNYDASGMATAGIVLGIIDICGFFLWLALL